MVQKKTQSMIKKAAKSGDKNAVRLYARELVNINKQSDRLHVNRATIDSIGMKLQEQQQMLKIQGSLSKSTEIMREVNSLVSLPQLRNSAQELERELMKSGIINEMVDDLVDEVDEDEELMEEEEVQAIDPISVKPHEPNDMNLLRLCDVHNIPVATNIATAEALIHALERGDRSGSY